jgi:Uma2 family endonuclease
VEVAHTTLGYDRGIKLPLYAVSGIPEVWIVDLDARTVDVHREPTGGRFRFQERAGPGDVLHPRMIPSITVPVERILS